MVGNSGRKPKPAKEHIISMKKQGLSTSAIIAKLGIRTQQGKDYVYHVISEARTKGLLKAETSIEPQNLPALPPPAASGSSGSGNLIIEEAPIAEEAQEVSQMYSERKNTELPKENLPIFQQSTPPASSEIPQQQEQQTEATPEPVDDGVEIDLSDITEIPIEIEDKIFRRRHLEPLTEQEKQNIRNHGNVMIQRRIHLKHPLGDVINYAKAVIKPVMTRVVGKKFTQDVEQNEQQQSDAMKEYDRIMEKKQSGGN